MSTTLVAMFDHKNEAENAVQALTDAGAERDRIKIVTNDDAKSGDRSASFWQDLLGSGTPEDDIGHHAEGVRRGGAVIVLSVDDSRADKVEEILHEYNPVDVDERVQKWREDGYTGYDEQADVYSAEQVKAERERYAIPVVEEDIKVGKREVSGGGKRIRTYVSETPVEEQVTLREETVKVKRTDVDRAVTDADRAFEEKTIEMTASSEEAVVSKEARVVGEVVVDKDVSEHTETVSETVRKTEVEVEDVSTKKT